MSNEREAFEAWAVQEARRMKYSFPEDTVQINGLGDYAIVWVQGAWLGHQAGAEWQRSQQSAPAGWHELLQEVAEYAPPYGTIVAMTSQMALGSKARRLLAAAPKAEQPPVQEPLAQYDAGLLNDFGGGNVEWWQDYLRAELGRAHDFYQSQIAIAAPQPVSDAYRMAVDTGLVCAHIGVTNQEDDYETARKKLNDLICWSVQVDRDLGQPSDDAKDALVEALEVLAKLGNGEHYGNSDGNVIAQMALAAYRAAMGE